MSRTSSVHRRQNADMLPTYGGEESFLGRCQKEDGRNLRKVTWCSRHRGRQTHQYLERHSIVSVASMIAVDLEAEYCAAPS